MRFIKKNCKPANWQDVVDKYYEKHKGDHEEHKEEFHKSETDVLKIFEIDYDLRSEVKAKQL